MPTFRSDSSANTNLSVNVYEVSRWNNAVRFLVDWSVTLGSSTGLGTGSTNYRDLYIKRSADGATLATQRIKGTDETWSASQTYSGSFTFDADIGTNEAGSFSIYIQTNNTGVQACIWTNRSYCTDFSINYSLYYTGCGAPSSPSLSPGVFENSLTFSWGAASPGINNYIIGYHVYYRLNYGSEIGVDVGNTTNWAPDTSGWERNTVTDFHVAAITQRGDNPWSGWSNAVRKNRIPNTPANQSVPQTSYVYGDTIRVSFSNPGDPDGNLTGFEVATDQSDSVVASRADGSAGYVDVPTGALGRGIQRKFKVRGYDAFGIRGAWSDYTAQVTINSAPNTPTNITTDKTLYVYGETIRISFSNSGDPDGNLTGFEVATNLNENVILSTTSPGGVNIDVPTALLGRAIQRMLRIRGYDALGARGAWSAYTSLLTINSAPNAPTNPSVPKSTYIPGDVIRVSFTNNGDPDGNLAGFEVATDQNETVIGSNASGSATYADVNTSGWSFGIHRRFRVRSYDTFGARSTWSAYTGVVLLGMPLKIPIGGALKQVAEIKQKRDGALKAVPELKVAEGKALKTLV